jgi:predicted AlkP superfamily pyrophosphatase or phosphodiesterase
MKGSNFMSLTNRVFVMSIDSFVYDDLEIVKGFPNFSRILNGCSMVKNITTVYPSFTYPIHVSMMTGTYPDKHGIIHNEAFMPGVKCKQWNFMAGCIKSKTLLEIAKESGYTTSSVFWPVMGRVKADWVIPEMWCYDPEGDMQEAMERGATKGLLDELWHLSSGILNWQKQPGFDEFAVRCALEIIKTRKPELMFLHVVNLDIKRHYNGMYSQAALEALKIHDEQLRRIITALEEAGVYNDTTFILTSDHGHTPCDKLIAPNRLFMDEGLVKIDGNGQLCDWDVLAKSAAHSAHIYINKYKTNKDFKDEFYRYLTSDEVMDKLGIEQVFTNDEAERQFHLKGEFSFVIEGKDGYAYQEEIDVPLLTIPNQKDYKYSISTHGHLPYKGPKPPFILRGKGIRPGVTLESANIVDEPVTIAELLGLDIPDKDGKVISELLDR